ncbi:hypothetical protein [Paenibacillus chibensis]|uniref:hypothetical protein n=1 Tax=Paenibacillus chibensis TaxID=59846 RepID=UPI000FDC7168|nr:hypothetical protein [Paenibacillus chibensis]MEC0371682.1 hypothetical protein [Paenibacillus chibensis]
MTLGKITLTCDEINEYNRLKQKIREARTRMEISLYTKQAENILERGRLRYVSKLENNSSLSSNPQVKGMETKSGTNEKKARLSAYAPSKRYPFPHPVKQSPILSKLVKSSSGR